MRTRLINSFTLLALLVLVLSFNSCDKPVRAADFKATIGGNPLVTLAIAEYLPNNDKGSLKALYLCLNKIVIRNSERRLGEIHLNFKTGQERIIPSFGSVLEELQIPSGHYNRMTIEVANLCGRGRSLGLANSSGTFDTDQPVSLEFWGDVVLSGTSQNLLFSIQPIVENLIGVTSDTQVIAQAQASAGSFVFAQCVSEYSSRVLADNPIGYWMLNETSGTTAFDSGSGINNATYNVSALLGQAPPFPGGLNYSVSSSGAPGGIAETIPSSTSSALEFSGSNVLTIEFWAKSSDVTTDIGFFSPSYGFGLGTAPCNPNQFKIRRTPTNTVCVNGYVRDTLWHHYAMTSESDGIQVYVDGVMIGASPDNQNYASCGSAGCTVQFGNFAGSLAWQSEVAIYRTALSAARIQAHYNARLSCM